MRVLFAYELVGVVFPQFFMLPKWNVFHNVECKVKKFYLHNFSQRNAELIQNQKRRC